MIHITAQQTQFYTNTVKLTYITQLYNNTIQLHKLLTDFTYLFNSINIP